MKQSPKSVKILLMLGLIALVTACGGPTNTGGDANPSPTNPVDEAAPNGNDGDTDGDNTDGDDADSDAADSNDTDGEDTDGDSD